MHSCLKYFRDREVGSASRAWEARFAHRRLWNLALSKRKIINSVHDGGVTCLSLEAVDSRYLLSASSDSSIAIYDTEAHNDGSCPEVGQVRRGHPDSHRFLVSSLTWYPVDTGLFISGAFDHEVKVWDTNTLQPACRFVLPGKVFSVAMSSTAATHCLVAVGGEEPLVKLCDPASGAFTHTLTGHRQVVWALSWSLQSEYQLMSGDKAGQLRLWDIRRSGTVAILDQQCTSTPETPKYQAPTSNLRRRNHTAAAVTAKARLSNPAATAHGGSITGVLPTPDGLYWMSAATDDRLRLWDSHHHHNLLVNYSGAYNRTIRGKQFAISDDGRTAFHPSGSVIQVFEVESGEQTGLLREAHFDAVNCCVWNGRSQELYSGSNDHQILVWDLPDPLGGGEGEGGMDVSR